MIRILIADDHEMVRRGVRSILERQPGWDVCGEAATGREAVALARQLKPDLVVMDITMPELNGFEATRRIRENSPETKVLVLTMHESEQMAREAFRAGARGYVLKGDSSSSLIAAIEHVRVGKPFFTGRYSGILHEAPAPRASRGRKNSRDGLTPREREVVQLIAEGHTTKEIAARLHITFKTAETHRANILRKLKLHSAGQLVRYAIRTKLVQA